MFLSYLQHTLVRVPLCFLPVCKLITEPPIFQRTLPFPFSLPFSFQKFNKKCSKYVIILVLSLLVGLMLIGIGVMMCMRRKKTPNNNDSVTLIQRGGESRLLLIFKKKSHKNNFNLHT